MVLNGRAQRLNEVESCSRRFACNCTSMQSFENRFSLRWQQRNVELRTNLFSQCGIGLRLKMAIEFNDVLFAEIWDGRARAHGRPDSGDQRSRRYASWTVRCLLGA